MRRGAKLALLGLALLVLQALARIVAGKLAGPLVLARAEAQFERELGPLLEASAPAATRGDGRGVQLLLDAAEAIRGEGSPLATLGRLGSLATAPHRPDRLDAVRRAVEVNREPLARLHAAADLPLGGLAAIYASRPVTKRRPTAAELEEFLERMRRGERLPGPPHPSVLSDAAELLRLDAELALLDGNTARRDRDLVTLGALAALLRHEPPPDSPTLAARVEKQLLAVVHRSLAEVTSAAEIDALDLHLARIEATPRYREALARQTAAERQSIRELIASGLFRQRASDTWEVLLSPWTAEHLEADHLLAAAAVGRAARTPFPRWRRQWKNPPERGPRLLAWLWPLAPLPGLGVSATIGGAAAAADEQLHDLNLRLARLALALARARLEGAEPDLAAIPRGQEPLLFTDRPPSLERNAAGEIVLTAPGLDDSVAALRAWLGLRPEHLASRIGLARWSIPVGARRE